MIKTIQKTRPKMWPIFFVLSLCAFQGAWAANLFVSATLGTDDNAPGRGQTVINPYKSITFALSKAASGDVLTVAAGLYQETIVCDKQITLKGPNAAISPNGGFRVFEAILQPPLGGVGLQTNGFDVTINGFRLDANGARVLIGNGGSLTLNRTLVTGVGEAGRALVECGGLQNLSVVDNRFFNFGSAGGSFALEASQVVSGLVQENSFQNIEGGVRVGNNLNMSVRRNRFESIQGFGVNVLDEIGTINSLNTLIEENLFDKNNLTASGTTGALWLSVNAATQSVKVFRNYIQNSFNGIYTDAAGSTTSTKVSVNYNIFAGNTNAGVLHESPGVLDIAGNFWGTNNGPQHNTNPSGSGNQKVLPASGSQARFSPWMATNADASSALTGYQYPTPTTFVVRSTVPVAGLGLVQRANDLAFDDDIIEFRDASYNINGENATITKDLTFSAGINVTFRDLTFNGASDLATVTLNGNFDARRVNFTPGNGGQILTGAFRLRLNANGQLTEAAGGKYVIGKTVVRRSVTAAVEDFGNVSVHFQAGASALGNITVTRDAGPGTAATLPGGASINRLWQIAGANSSISGGRNVKFSWLSDDDNGLMLANARLFYSANGTSGWTTVGLVQDVSGGDPRVLTAKISANGFYTVGNYTCTVVADAGADSPACVDNGFMLGGAPTASSTDVPVTYSWAPTTGLDNATSSNPIFTATASGTITFTVTVTDAAGCMATDAITLTVNPRPTATAGADKFACPDFSIVLDGAASGGLTPYVFAWTPNNGSLSDATIATPTVNLLTAGTFAYVLTVTDANGCKHTDEAKVITTPITINAGADVAYCLGGQNTLGVTASGGDGALTFDWSPTAGLSAANVANPTFTPTAPGTYIFTATATDGLGCQNSDNVQVIVHPIPMMTAGVDKETCAGVATALEGDAIGGTAPLSFQWFPTQRLSNANAAMPDFMTTVPGSYLYLLIVSDVNGCSASDNVTVFVNANPVANAGADINVCAGITAQFNGSASGGSSPYQFSWTPDNATLDATNVANPFVTIDAPGMYAYTMRATDGNGCFAEDMVNVTVGQVTVNAGSDVTRCPGKSFTLNATASGGFGGYMYNWAPMGNITSGANTNSPTFNISAPGNYTYTLTVTDSKGCMAMDDVTVTIGAPVMANAGPDRETCAGAPIQLLGFGSGGNGFYSYNWFPEQRLDNPFGQNPNFNHSVPGTYLYLLTVTDGNGCQGFDNVTVQVLPQPTVNAGSDISSCLGGSFILNGSVFGGSAPYFVQWAPNNNTLSNPNNLITTASIDAVGSFTYILDVTDANGCSASDAVTVNTNFGNFADAGPDKTVCANANVVLDGKAVGDNGSFGFSWSPSTGLTNPNDDAPVFNIKTPGVYQYILTVANPQGCFSQDVVTVTVLDTVRANAGTDKTVCPNTSVQLNVSATGGTAPYVYEWTPSGQFFTTSSTIRNPRVSIPTAGVYTYNARVTDSKGCVTEDAVRVTVLNGPMANAGPDRELCFGSSGMLMGSVTGGAGTITYAWTPNDGSLSDATMLQPMVNLPNPGNYTYTLTAKDENNCSSTDAVNVKVQVGLFANAGEDKMICPGDTVMLMGTVTGGQTSNFVYTWTPNTGVISALGSANARVTLTTPGTYVYTFTASDGAGGCAASDQVSIVVKNAPVANAGPDRETCLNGPVSLLGNASGGNGNYTYQWFPSDRLDNASSQNPNFNHSIPGTYLYLLTVNDGSGCIGRDNMNVVLYSNPMANAGPSILTCTGGSATLQGSATGGAGGYTFSWSPDNGTVAEPHQAVTGVMIPSPGTYTYLLKVTDAAGCAGQASTTVRVRNAAIANAGADRTICPGGSTALSGSVSNAEGGFGFFWTPQTNITAGASTLTPTISISAPGTYVYTLSVSDGTGCVTTDQVTVTVIAPVVANAGPDLITCLADAVSLQGSASGGAGDYFYQWSPAINLSDATNPTTNFIQVAPGNYTYTLTVSDEAGCNVSTDMVMLTVVPYFSPRVVATTEPASCSATPSGKITVTANTDAGDPNQLFSYSIDGVNFQQSNFFTGLAAGTYQVTIKNQIGCSNTTAITVAGTSAPEIALINSVTSLSARVIWNETETPVQSYTLQYRVLGSTVWTDIAGLTSTIQILNGLQNMTKYETRVRGVCGNGGFTAWSQIKTFQTLEATNNVCRTAGGMFVTPVDATSAMVMWTPLSSSPTCYTISYGPSNVAPTMWTSVTVQHPTAQYTMTGLQAGVTYQVRIRTNCTFCSTNSGQLSDWSPRIPFTTVGGRETLEALPNETAPVRVTVYPNPTRGALTVRLTGGTDENVTLSIRDLTGRAVYRQMVSAPEAVNEYALDLAGQAAGIYLLEIRSGNAVENVKVVLK